MEKNFISHNISFNFEKSFLIKLLCFISVIQLLSFKISYAQNSTYTRNVIYSLTSEFMGGRGYVFKGDRRAADFIRYEFKSDSLIPIADKYFQPFSFPVNTFPNRMTVIVDNEKILGAGVDYIVNPASCGAHGRYDLVWVTDTTFNIDTNAIRGKVVVFDKTLYQSKESKQHLREWNDNIHGASGVIMLEEKKLTWGVEQHQNTFFGLSVLKNSLKPGSKFIRADIDAKFVQQHNTQNIIGEVMGSVPDTFLVFTAHYDHLGWMGKQVYFPGANDNASGTSMMLNLAKYYSQHKPKYSMLFFAFAGEEAGLLGSKFYTEHPLLPLERIKFLINMDLLGTGDEGMMVVNATEYEAQYNALVKINDEKKYLAKIGKRGKAANSDHYWFSEKGVPSFFFYTLGGIAAYHDIYDRPETLPLTKYREVFQLITDFVTTF